MRHRKSGRKLKRTSSHKKALLSALITSLIRHKRITTTLAKAKETRSAVEKMITRARNAVASSADNGDAGDSRAKKFAAAAGHARREVGRVIRDRTVLAELFSTVAPKVAARPGGYTRIVKLGQRQGDAAELAVIELVDFQAVQEKAEKAERTRKGTKPGKTGTKRKSSKVLEAAAAGSTVEHSGKGA